MQVKEAMSRDFKIIKPDTTLKEAAEMMRDCGCGYLPVGENDRLTGAITDRDIIIRGIAAGHDPNDAMAKNVMTGKITYCYENDDVKDAAEQMKKKQIRRLVVLDENKRMTGVISIGDIARADDDEKLAGEIECALAKAA